MGMWDLDYKQGWMLNWCFRNALLEKTLESPLDCKQIKSVNPKSNQPWIFIERTDAKAQAPILWPPDAKSRLIGKDFHAGRDWGQEEKGTTEDEMVGWHHLLNGHEFEQTPGDGEGHLAWWRTSGVLQSMGSQSQTRLSAQNVVSSNKKQTT